MPYIYYSYYTPVSDSISDVTCQEHQLGQSLLLQGLRDLFQMNLNPDSLEALLAKDEFGKPCLPSHPEIHFNITHCKGLVACAFDSTPIGIDVELPGYFPEVLINHALSENEKCFLQAKGSDHPSQQEWFYRFWTLKEAFVKKSGIGVDTNLKSFCFSFLETDNSFQPICSDSSVSCYQTMLSSGHILSVCHSLESSNIKLVSCSEQPGQLK